jgi:dTDP-4-dehydrorhamnose reductase
MDGEMELVIGDGLIGKNLYYYLRKFGDVVLTTRKEVDLGKDEWVVPECDTVYICAAVTKTVECENNPIYSRKVNVENTIKLAGKFKKVVWISSERVFDGSIGYRKKEDIVCPTTEYGMQKAEAEEILLDMGASVIRFSKVLGYRVDLFDTWIKLLENGEVIHPYSDMGMAPIPVELAVNALYRVSRNGTGLYQLSADRDIPYHRIAYHICNQMGKDMELVQPVESGSPHPNTTLESDFDSPNAWDVIHEWWRCR